jgi:predicted CXXCH cytochrome family protein
MEDDKVVFSAEFNLCTTCHMVDLDATADGSLFSYSLSADSYSAANMVDAATSTFSEVAFEIENADGTMVDRTVYATQVFYHDNTPGGERSFIDTHFAGTVVGRLAAADETDPAAAVADVTVTGYNVNAAAVDACTTCHDPHSANKVQGEAGVAQAQSFAEGVGTFHANYFNASMGYAVRDSCLPCHSGGEGFVTWLRGGSAPSSADSTPYVACRTCHQLEQLADSVDEEGNTITALGDPTAVREFEGDHVFAFADGDGNLSGGVEVDVADLGVNQICFECHKGRVGVKPTADTTTRAYDVAYLHYAASFATLFGNESGMVPTYAGKSYADRFVHAGGVVDADSAEFGCADCHNVHNSKDNRMFVSTECTGCHGSGAFADAAALEDRTAAYGERLRATIIAQYNSRFDPDLTEADFDVRATERNDDTEMLANDLAKATAIYTIFNYHDGYFTGADGHEHGHGGSWAHNSKFARQLQYDAIEALGGDLTGLSRP